MLQGLLQHDQFKIIHLLENIGSIWDSDGLIHENHYLFLHLTLQKINISPCNLANTMKKAEGRIRGRKGFRTCRPCTIFDLKLALDLLRS